MSLVAFWQAPVLLIWPEGGQRQARRNARTAVDADRWAAHERREADQALAAAAAGRPALRPHG